MKKLLTIINSVLASNSLPISDSITNETRLRDDLGFDSFGLAELTVHIEEEFNIDVFADGLVETIGEVKVKLGL